MPTRDGSGPDHEELLLLWCARRTGVLDALTTTAGTAEAVVRETGLDNETSHRFVRALSDYGYLRRVGDEYEVTNRALGFLATRDVRSIGALPRALDLLDAAAALGGDGERERGESDQRRRHRLGAHAATPRRDVQAGVTAAIHAAPDAEHVVDVYGGSGVYAVEATRRGRDVTLVETDAVLDVVTPMLAGHGVETVAAREGGVPVDDADLALLAGVLNRHSSEGNQSLLSHVHSALAPGGTVAVLTPEDDAETRRIRVERLLCGRGDAYTAPTVEEWLREAGFVDCETRDVTGGRGHLVVGRCERGVD